MRARICRILLLRWQYSAWRKSTSRFLAKGHSRSCSGAHTGLRVSKHDSCAVHSNILSHECVALRYVHHLDTMEYQQQSLFAFWNFAHSLCLISCGTHSIVNHGTCEYRCMVWSRVVKKSHLSCQRPLRHDALRAMTHLHTSSALLVYYLGALSLVSCLGLDFM